MTIKIGSYQMVVNPTHRRETLEVSQEQVQNIEYALDILAGMLCPFDEWRITGGLVIPLTTGKFYRPHLDIDIGVDENRLEHLADAAKPHGYELFSRKAMVKLNGKNKLDIYKEVSPRDAMRTRCRNLRLVRVDCEGRAVRHDDILDYLDIYPFRIEGDRLISNDGDVVVQAKYVPGETYTTITGKKIKLRSLAYVEALKSRSKSAKDVLDLKKIEEFMKGKR